MTFTKPEFLWLMPLCLFGIALALIAYVRHKQMLNGWNMVRGFFGPSTRPPLQPWRYVLSATAITLSIACGVMALSRPCVHNQQLQFPAGTVDAIVLVDVSRSMAARDCDGQTRLATAKQALDEHLLQSLETNQVGIVTYAGRATVNAHLTFDVRSLRWLARNGLQVNSTSGDGSALGNAFGLAFDVFDKLGKPGREHLIILLSDGGRDDDTKLEEVVRGCRERKVQLIVLGLGGTDPSAIPVADLTQEDKNLASGKFYMVNGEIAKTSLDEPFLLGLAEACGGSYRNVKRASEADLGHINTGIEMREHAADRELFHYFVCGYFCLLAVGALATKLSLSKIT